MKKLHHTVFGSNKVNSLCFQAVTHPFAHQSQRDLTSLEIEFEKKRRVWSMPLQYGLRWFRIPSRFSEFLLPQVYPNIFPVPPPYSLFPFPVFREKLRDVREF